MAGYGAFIVALLIMKLAPQSPLGRLLNAALVERPMNKVAAMDRRQVIFLLIVLGVSLFATDMVLMFGSYDLFTLYAWDLTVYLDVTMLAFAMATVARGRSALRWLALRGSPLLRRGARSRARRTRTASPNPQDRSANDDDPAPAWSLAA